MIIDIMNTSTGMNVRTSIWSFMVALVHDHIPDQLLAVPATRTCVFVKVANLKTEHTFPSFPYIINKISNL